MQKKSPYNEKLKPKGGGGIGTVCGNSEAEDILQTSREKPNIFLHTVAREFRQEAHGYELADDTPKMVTQTEVRFCRPCMVTFFTAEAKKEEHEGSHGDIFRESAEYRETDGVFLLERKSFIDDLKEIIAGYKELKDGFSRILALRMKALAFQRFAETLDSQNKQTTDSITLKPEAKPSYEKENTKWILQSLKNLFGEKGEVNQETLKEITTKDYPLGTIQWGDLFTEPRLDTLMEWLMVTYREELGLYELLNNEGTSVITSASSSEAKHLSPDEITAILRAQPNKNGGKKKPQTYSQAVSSSLKETNTTNATPPE